MMTLTTKREMKTQMNNQDTLEALKDVYWERYCFTIKLTHYYASIVKIEKYKKNGLIFFGTLLIIGSGFYIYHAPQSRYLPITPTLSGAFALITAYSNMLPYIKRINILNNVIIYLRNLKTEIKKDQLAVDSSNCTTYINDKINQYDRATDMLENHMFMDQTFKYNEKIDLEAIEITKQSLEN